MKRRAFIAGLGGAAAWPLAARTQRGEQVRRVAMLRPTDETDTTHVALFTQGLAELGWINGRNLRLDIRWAGGNLDRMRTLALELIDLQPDVIVVATRAVQAQTRTIPIVFVYAGDPVANGLLANIARPEGNITGVTDLFSSIGGKWLELLKEAVPSLARVALVVNPDFLSQVLMEVIEAAAAQRGIKAVTITVPRRAQCLQQYRAELGRHPKPFAAGDILSVLFGRTSSASCEREGPAHLPYCYSPR
jgi:putative tryptophan/tyrosine transport system substrate-binding protein